MSLELYLERFASYEGYSAWSLEIDEDSYLIEYNEAGDCWDVYEIGYGRILSGESASVVYDYFYWG